MPRITNAMPETETPIAVEPIKYICSKCHAEVTMSVEEQNWYFNLGYALPGRCADCRRERRMRQNQKRKEKAAARKAGVANG